MDTNAGILIMTEIIMYYVKNVASIYFVLILRQLKKYVSVIVVVLIKQMTVVKDGLYGI